MQESKQTGLSDNIKIEKLSIKHAVDLFQVTDRNRAHLKEWLPWLDAVTAPTDTASFIQRSIDQFESGRGPNYAIFYNDSLCGVAGFHDIDPESQRGSIGYWLSEAYTGLGIMTKVVRALLSEGFLSYNLKCIEIRCAIENAPSRKIPERIGARLDRTARNAEWLYDHYVDHAVYIVEPSGEKV